MIGTSLGPYQVVALLGQGGMGAVYKAHDPRLGRDVAIKIPAERFTDRFAREARAIAALNHPNVCALYDVAPDFLVMELVEGPTLEDVIRGSQPYDAIAVARQIALALEAAHEAGIVHRDLKPANIKLRQDGTVKVLDFGLAKTTRRAGSREQDPSGTTVLTPGQTEVGVILGTAAYMSPEQVAGREADARSDIWAFGCVLFELLTGRRAFDAASVTETYAAVLRGDVDWSALPEATPPLVRSFLVRCLRPDPRERVHAIADVRLALEGAFDAGRREAAEPARDRRPRWRRALPITVAVLATAVVAGLLGRHARPAPAPPVVSRLQMVTPVGQTFYFSGRHLLAVSPAGTHVAYSAGLGLWLHRLDELEARPVPGAELEARSPFFSPDGQSIGYYAGGELRRVSVTGGAPVALTRAVNPWGAHWSANGAIYYGQGPDGIWKVPAEGGRAERVVAVAPGELAHGPQLLDEEWLLFTVLPEGVGSWNRAQIVVQSLVTTERIVLVSGGRDARYLPSGHLVYGLSGSLLAAPFDPTRRHITGSAVPVVRDVYDAGTVTGAMHFDISTNGTLVYAAPVGARLRLVWVDRHGGEEAIPGGVRAYRHARVAPDGSRIAVEVEEQGDTDIWVGDPARGTFTRLTSSDDVDSDPIWTPDASRIVFSSVRGQAGLFAMPADGSGPVERLTDGSGGVRALSWTSAGELVYEELAGAEVRVLTLDGRASPGIVTLFDAPEYFNEVLPALSPDGRWIAYQSTEAGTMEIFVRPFPDVSSGRWQISTGGGLAPLWSPNGREIYYRSATTLMAVPVQTSPTFTYGAPTPLFDLGDYALAGTRGVKYDVARDGRFLLLKDAGGMGGTQERIIVVQNWLEELERLVPVR